MIRQKLILLVNTPIGGFPPMIGGFPPIGDLPFVSVC
jgi:hypothetical protein